MYDADNIAVNGKDRYNPPREGPGAELSTATPRPGRGSTPAARDRGRALAAGVPGGGPTRRPFPRQRRSAPGQDVLDVASAVEHGEDPNDPIAHLVDDPVWPDMDLAEVEHSDAREFGSDMAARSRRRRPAQALWMPSSTSSARSTDSRAASHPWRSTRSSSALWAARIRWVTLDAAARGYEPDASPRPAGRRVLPARSCRSARRSSEARGSPADRILPVPDVLEHRFSLAVLRQDHRAAPLGDVTKNLRRVSTPRSATWAPRCRSRGETGAAPTPRLNHAEARGGRELERIRVTTVGADMAREAVRPRREKWTLSFDAELKEVVVQAARRRGGYPVTLLALRWMSPAPLCRRSGLHGRRLAS